MLARVRLALQSALIRVISGSLATASSVTVCGLLRVAVCTAAAVTLCCSSLSKMIPGVQKRSKCFDVRHSMLNPDILGCARDARVEAKAVRRDDKRAREASPDVVRLPGGGDPMGGGDGDSFQAAQARCVCV